MPSRRFNIPVALLLFVSLFTSGNFEWLHTFLAGDHIEHCIDLKGNEDHFHDFDDLNCTFCTVQSLSFFELDIEYPDFHYPQVFSGNKENYYIGLSCSEVVSNHTSRGPPEA